MNIILNNKPKLIRWLAVDSLHILQHVQSKQLITTAEYDRLMSEADSRRAVIHLLDVVYNKGERACKTFLDLLKEDDVNEISPELKEWIGQTFPSESSSQPAKSGSPLKCNISASGGSHVCAPVISGSTTGSVNVSSVSSTRPENQILETRRDRTGTTRNCQDLLSENTSFLTQNVKNIDPILDDLQLHKELVANVRSEGTCQQKMRKLLEYVNCERVAEDLVHALHQHEGDLMKELPN